MIFFFLSQILLTGKAGKVTAAGVVSGMETGMEQLCCVSEDLKTINECSVSILLCCHGSPAFSRGSFREQLGLGKSSGGNEPPLLKLLSQCLISSRTSSAGLFMGRSAASDTNCTFQGFKQWDCTVGLVFYLLSNSIEQTVLGNMSR